MDTILLYYFIFLCHNFSALSVPKPHEINTALNKNTYLSTFRCLRLILQTYLITRRNDMHRGEIQKIISLKLENN